jgi:hypothetical protein
VIDIQTLGTAIKALYDGTSGASLRALTGNGKLFQGLAPQGTALPYICFFMIDDTPDDTFTEEMSECRVQFSIFMKSGATNTIGQIQRALKVLYHEIALSITGYAHIGTECLISRDLGIDEENIHQIVTDFKFITQKS